MPFFIRGPSVIPRSCPLFNPIWDGPEPKYELRDAALARLEKCFPLGPDTKPPSTVLLSKAACYSAHKTLPDFFGVYGLLCISSRFKAIIEQLEPNSHQYFPIALYKKNRDLFDGDYYLFNILRTADSVLIDKSCFSRARLSPTSDWFIIGGGTLRTLAADGLAGHHVWRERAYMEDIYISDDVMLKYKKGKLKGFDYLNCSKVNIEI